MNGILLINKKENMTSRDVVNKVGKIFGTKKIGHTGTLDPMATGVLVLCIGTATKLVEILTSENKEYEAEMILGISTDTYDITGNILENKSIEVPEDEIKEVLSKLEGTYNQEVPIYSAVKINGKKLYEYARSGKQVDLPKRQVTIFNIEMTSYDIVNNQTKFSFKCKVSKGTYIRSLVCDIASKLNTVGCMTKLKRVKQGNFTIDECYQLEDIEKGNFKLIEIDDCLNNFYKEMVEGDLLKKITNGSIIDNIWDKDTILFTTREGKILAIYKTYDKDNTKLKPWKMLNN